jgi:pimeloyl-ACP methyl ester carboxylesterase
MTNDIADEFLNAQIARRLQIVEDEAHAPALKAFLGEAAFAEYRRLAAKLGTGPGGHLAFGAPKNLIFVPGVMGSLLHSRTHGGVWWIDVRNRARIDQLALTPDGTQDVPASNDILPTTSDLSYDAFMSAVLQEEEFGHEIFSYDWRKPIRASAEALRNLVLKLYAENGERQVHLVAHSMGGLVVRATLMEYGGELWPKLGKIVFLGTPHYGSPSIAGYLKNHLWGSDWMALLGLYLSRETLRSLWGVLALLPAPAGIYPGTRLNDPDPWIPSAGDGYVHPCANFDLYQVDQWKLDLSAESAAHLQTVLDGAAAFHRDLYRTQMALDREALERMLVIAGVGYETLFRLANRTDFFGMWEHMTKITKRVPGIRHREGDSRVPVASAALENVSIRYIRGVHGELPNMPPVYRNVFRFLKDETMDLPDTEDGALSTHLAPNESSETPHLDGTAFVSGSGDDPGIWNLEPPASDVLERLRAELEMGRLPQFTRIRLL